MSYAQYRDMTFADAEDKLLDLKTQFQDHKTGLYNLTPKQIESIKAEIKLLKYMFPGLIFSEHSGIC